MEENNLNPEVEVSTEATPTEPKLTFDELLKDPDYQAEFDRKVESARTKWYAKWQKDAEKERSEAEALAKMTEEEKHAHEIKKLREELRQKDAIISSRELKDEALKIISEKKLNPSLINMIDFSGATAEKVKEQIDMLEEVFRKAVEESTNERFKQPRPKEFRGDHVTSEKQYLDSKYGDNPYYKK